MSHGFFPWMMQNSELGSSCFCPGTDAKGPWNHTNEPCKLTLKEKQALFLRWNIEHGTIIRNVVKYFLTSCPCACFAWNSPSSFSLTTKLRQPVQKMISVQVNITFFRIMAAEILPDHFSTTVHSIKFKLRMRCVTTASRPYNSSSALWRSQFHQQIVVNILSNQLSYLLLFNKY